MINNNFKNIHLLYNLYKYNIKNCCPFDEKVLCFLNKKTHLIKSRNNINKNLHIIKPNKIIILLIKIFIKRIFRSNNFNKNNLFIFRAISLY